MKEIIGPAVSDASLTRSSTKPVLPVPNTMLVREVRTGSLRQIRVG